MQMFPQTKITSRNYSGKEKNESKNLEWRKKTQRWPNKREAR